MRRRRNILGRLLMVLGGLLVLSGLVLFGYNRGLENTADKASEAILFVVQQKIEENCGFAEDKGQTVQQMELDGTRYLGVLNIPALELELPVQADWSYEKLLTTPCVYKGSIQDGGLVILAHNYRRHFGGIRHLRPGDEIRLTDAVGSEFLYQVDELTVLDAVEVEEMADHSCDLSLFTCTYGGKARVTVRCTLQNKMDRYPVIESP